MKEEQDRKEQEERKRKACEEAVAAANKKREKEEGLQAEAARKKEEDLEQLKVKQRILQQKFEEMKLPPKPPLPAIPTPQFSSLPPRVTLAPPIPPLPFAPSTIASRAPIMIPGLLLDTMDMGPRAPETPMAVPVSGDIPPATHEFSQNGAIVTSQNEDTIMKDAPDNRSFTRKKRPIAADFDTEPSMKIHQPKRRFGSLKEGPFIFELTEDEDEDTEVDEPISNSSLKRQNSIRLPSQASKSPPAINGGAKPECNGKSPPARTSSAASGTTDAAKQLQDTEEKIRRLREEIQARQEKKRKPSATATPTGTGTPVRVATPLEIPRLGFNSSFLLPLPSAQLPLPSAQLPLSSPSNLSQPEKTTRVEIPGLGLPSPNDTLAPSSSVAASVVEVNPSTESEQSEETLAVEQSEAIQPSTHVPNLIPSDSQQKADEEGESQKMRDEAERLRMLLLSKRKAMELRQVKSLGIAKEQLSQTPVNAEIIGEAQEVPPVPIEIIDITSAVRGDNLNPSTTNEMVLDCITQGIEIEVASEKSESPPPLYCVAPDVTEKAPDTVLISEAAGGQPKPLPCQLPQSINQQLGAAATDEPESPPYEPFLENIRIDYESPPYEPSLGFEEGVHGDLGDKMDVDVSDAEEGEIMEESVDMEVDSGEDDAMQDILPTTATISKGKNPDPPEVKSIPWGTQGKDKSQPLTSTIAQSTILPPKPPSPTLAMIPVLLSEERVNRPDPATVTANEMTSLTAMPMYDAKVIPNAFTEYESPLRQFRSYRYHPQYLIMVKGGWRSLTFSNRIDPDKLFCVYEISGGKCNDTSCEKQHFRQIALSDDEILVELGSVMEGDTDAVRNSYRDGLRELITNMRTRKVNDFETVAVEISLYRSRFFNDTSRVVRLTKGP